MDERYNSRSKPTKNIILYIRIKNSWSRSFKLVQVDSNCIEPIDFFKLFFTNELIDKLVEEITRYTCDEIAEKQLSKRSA